MDLIALLRRVLAIGLLMALCHANAQNYPFGSRLDHPNGYPYGIRSTTPNIDATVIQKYTAWKNARVRSASTIPGGRVVTFTDSSNDPRWATSEGIGYGMLITVTMAGSDSAANPNAKQIFDGLLTTARARYANGLQRADLNAQYGAHAPFLMAWELGQGGAYMNPQYENWPALDGDLDIALALLMAHRQWGSTGTWNYQDQALKTIAAIKAWFTYPDGRLRLVQGGENTLRTSDLMFGHFRAFKAATGDSHWDSVVSKNLSILENAIAAYSSVPGLQPDFLRNTNTTPVPGLTGTEPLEVCSPLGDGTSSDRWYFSNAQRNPWRFASDYIFSGDTRVRAILMKMMNFFRTDTNGDPSRTPIGYKLDGTLGSCLFRPIDVNWAYGMYGPMLAGATVDSSFQTWLETLWAYNVDNFNTGYYNGELQLLPMLVASGNWWRPTASAPPPSGMKVQAELGQRQGSLTVKTDIPGYEGTGHVGTFEQDGDRLTVTFTNVTAGTYDVRIRYQTWQQQLNGLSINGAAVTSQSFPATGSGWAIKTVNNVTLASGTNTVAIVKDWGYMDVDYIEIAPVGGSIPTTVHTEAEAGTRTGSLTVKTDIPGYQGTGFVGWFTAAGDTLTVPLPITVAGNYNVRIRYFAWTPQQNTVRINGGPPQNVQFPTTQPNWSIVTLPGTPLVAGTNNVQITKDDGYIDVDWVEAAP